nr:uncharacterized protein LOC109157470 [Ipomoea batatas]
MAPSPTNIKFLCSYGGKILPRHPDGKLRYYGGETRVLSVQRSISFADVNAPYGVSPCHEKGVAKLPQYAYHHGPGNNGSLCI